MGIKDFSKVFSKSSEINIKDFPPGEDYAYDAYIELFKNASMQFTAKLTNPAGEPTAHINICLMNVLKRIIQGGDDVWVFDSRDPRKADDPKKYILEKRADQRDHQAELNKALKDEITKLEELAAKTSKEQILALYPKFDEALAEKKLKLEKEECRTGTCNYFAPMVRDIQFILDCLGVEYIIAPSGVDSEQVCAHLCAKGRVDGVITTDTDTLVYGAKKILKKQRGKPGTKPKPGQYDVYVLDDCLKQYNLTRQQLAEIATILGCDFAPKTDKVGAGTVIAKYRKGIDLTDEQKKAVDVFMRDISNLEMQKFQPECSLESISKLQDWLVNQQGFKLDRVIKLLDPIREIYQPSMGKKKGKSKKQVKLEDEEDDI
jgi:5'-3' exonuclease